jgi:hypothetical protein
MIANECNIVNPTVQEMNYRQLVQIFKNAKELSVE